MLAFLQASSERHWEKGLAISSDTMKVLAMSRDIWVPRVYRFRNYLGQGCMS